MIKDITIGQYYPTDSVIHALDPRLKISATFIYIFLLFFVKTFIGYALCVVSLTALIIASKVPVGVIFRGLKPILFILIFTFALNALNGMGATILVQFWIIKITKESLRIAIALALRLILLILGTTMMTLTTTPIDLTFGLESLMKPLKILGFPAHEVAMMLSIALRFIPTLTEEADRIMKAQASRGASFDTGGIINRAKSIIPIIVPLIVSAFRRATDLATAMEARCYHGGEGRTRLRILKLKMKDYIAAMIIVAFIGIVVLDTVYLIKAFPYLGV